MINPRLLESESMFIQNDWTEFARLHALHFWGKGILYTRVAGTNDAYIKRSLYASNGLKEIPEQALELNDSVFTSSLMEAFNAQDKVCIVAHPLQRVAKMPLFLEKNMDMCSKAFLEVTGINWKSLSFRELIQTLKAREVEISSHWWCAQEKFMLFERNSYTMFRDNKIDDIAWWFGERGVLLNKEAFELEKEVSAGRLPSKSQTADIKLGNFSYDDLSSEDFRIAFLDVEIAELCQDIYTEDFHLYASASK